MFCFVVLWEPEEGGREGERERETGSPQVSEAGLKLTVLLPQPPG